MNRLIRITFLTLTAVLSGCGGGSGVTVTTAEEDQQAYEKQVQEVYEQERQNK